MEEDSESSDKEQAHEHKTFTVFQNITQLKLNEPFLNSGLLENDDSQAVNVKTTFATLVGHAKSKYFVIMNEEIDNIIQKEIDQKFTGYKKALEHRPMNYKKLKTNRVLPDIFKFVSQSKTLHRLNNAAVIDVPFPSQEK